MHSKYVRRRNNTPCLTHPVPISLCSVVAAWPGISDPVQPRGQNPASGLAITRCPVLSAGDLCPHQMLLPDGRRGVLACAHARVCVYVVVQENDLRDIFTMFSLRYTQILNLEHTAVV